MTDVANDPLAGDVPRNRSIAPALPRGVAGWVRKIAHERNLNDLVEDVHLRLVDNEKYLKLLEATHDAEAVEGSLSADNVMAAIMIRDAAREYEVHGVDNQKLGSIVRALGVVLRRYEVSRKERKAMVRGQRVPDDNNGME